LFNAGSLPDALALGDVDQDGTLDIVAANAGSSTVSVLRNNGDSTFGPQTDLAVGGSPANVLSGDLDGDGRPDLVIWSSSTPEDIQTVLGHGDGSFGLPSVQAGPGSPLAVSDLNQDGKSDLVVRRPNGTLGVLLSNGDGTFGTPTEYSVVPAGQNIVAVA